MDPRTDPAVLPHGQPQSHIPNSPPANLRRRLSIDEDYFYQRIVTADPSRPSRPPPYSPLALAEQRQANSELVDPQDGALAAQPQPATTTHTDPPELSHESLPGYSSSIELEGIFMRKHEIEDTTKRAEDRRWHTAFVTLNGTALHVHKAKKSRSWGKTRDGPGISPDNPPWMTKGKLEKTYSLLYADAGIAADYKKRRYVIRIRAETDQFLLSCIELSTFNRWLEGLFAAIDVALPIEDRDFPRDMSVPRIQRVRWFRGQTSNGQSIAIAAEDSPTLEPQPDPDGLIDLPAIRRSASLPSLAPNLDSGEGEAEVEIGAASRAEPVFDDESGDEEAREDAPGPPPRIDPAHRLSTTSYDNDGIDPHSGKWIPDHHWTSAHDELYAKLCYSNLLFRSPRKSNFIINKGKKWFVDWTTGRTVRVLPPAYGEVDFFGPWQVIHTENIRI